MWSWGQRAAYAVLMLSIFWGIVFIWQNRDVPNFGAINDDAVYVLSGRSISQSQGYRLSHLPDQPPQTKYPPVLAWVIAAAWSISPEFPNNLSLVIAFNAPIYVCYVILCFLLFRSWGFSDSVAAFLSTVASIHPIVLSLSTSVLSEMPYAVLLMATFLMIQKASTNHNSGAFAAGLLGGLAYLTRTAALPLAITVPVILWLQGKRKNSFYFLAGIFPALAGWQVWVSTQSPQTHDWVTLFYTNYMALEAATVGTHNISQIVYLNFDSLLTGMGNLLISSISDTYLGHNFGRLMAAAAMMGAYRLAKCSREWNYLAFGVLSCLLLLIWHYPPNERFSFPLLPLLLAGLWTECNHLAQLIASSWRKHGFANKSAAAFITCLLALFCLFFVKRAIEARTIELPAFEALARNQSQSLARIFQQVARLTPPHALIHSDHDTLLHLHTGRKSYRTIVPPALLYQSDPEAIQQEFAKLRDADARAWDYALVTRYDFVNSLNADYHEEIRLKIANRSDLEVVFQDPDATLYQRKANSSITKNSLPH